jgi:hypothetical protein
VPSEGAPDQNRVRTAEITAALSLATDLGMGLPYEHGLHSTLVALRLAERLGVDAETAGCGVLRLSVVSHRMYNRRRECGGLFPEGARLDAVAVAAVLEAAGQHIQRLKRPAGLTEREAVVVVMLARGLQTKQIARTRDLT